MSWYLKQIVLDLGFAIGFLLPKRLDLLRRRTRRYGRRDLLRRDERRLR